MQRDAFPLQPGRQHAASRPGPESHMWLKQTSRMRFMPSILTSSRKLFPVFLCLCAMCLLAVGRPTAAQTSSGNFDGPAELPRVRMETSMKSTPAPGKVIRVRAGANLEDALEKASCGDTIELQAGSTYSGKILLPAKKCDDSHWIIIRTSAPDSKLPPEGTRMLPCYAGVTSLPGRPPFHCPSNENLLAKIEFDGRGGSGPIVLGSGANH